MPKTQIDMLRHHALRVHDKVAAMLNTNAELTDETVHGLRVAAKEVRGLWQLLKPLLDDTRADQAIADLGKAVANLSETRDRCATSETLVRLCRRSRGKDARKTLNTALRLLQTTGSDTRISTIAAQHLRTSWAEDYQRWATLEVDIEAAELIPKGYGRLYRKAQRLTLCALENDDIQLWHKLRKWVKYLALTLPLAGSSRKLRTLRTPFTRLATKLGRLHDLETLRIALSRLDWPDQEVEQTALVDHLVNRAMVQALNECAALAGELFAQKPREFIRDLQRQGR